MEMLEGLLGAQGIFDPDKRCAEQMLGGLMVVERAWES